VGFSIILMQLAVIKRTYLRSYQCI